MYNESEENCNGLRFIVGWRGGVEQEGAAATYKNAPPTRGTGRWGG
ncbi:MAG: hypothetical protein IKB33_06050 [Spirochaetaceae bacterium]|nr:hypothetical protein [Spirochaetaceae bacterium]